jgi:hypothetical protein
MWTTPSADLHQEQDVEPAQADGVEVEEVRGQQARCLRAQEGAPRGVCSSRGGTNPGGGQDAPDRARTHPMAESGEFSLHTPMPPAGIFPRQSDD